MAADNKEIWITTGYEIFALTGQAGLKVEPLAKSVGISKSSFYHHFADIEFFIEQLMKYHLERSYIMAEKEQNAQNIDPELINILVEHKTDLLFNRQLRINKNIKLFAETLLQSNKIVGEAFIMLWVKDLNLRLSKQQTEALFTLALENFFLQINAGNLTRTWLSGYFTDLKRIAGNFV
jgi:AcrR family transcriptional regulator